MLQDTSTYKILQTDPTTSLQRKSNLFVKKMYEEKWIDFGLKKYLTSYVSISPKIYGLAKVHKPNLSLRPVISSVNSPTYHLSKFMADILSYIRNDDINIRSSDTLPQMLSSVRMDPEYTFASFDAVSLFTCVDVELVMNILEKRWNDIKVHTALDKNTFFDVMEFCLKNGYCEFQGRVYSQIQGVAMGNPLSPIVSELVLDTLFLEIQDKFKESLKFMIKFVDDSLLIIKDTAFQDIFDFLNSFHERIKFTYEKNFDNMNFLDIQVIRCELGTLQFRHYKKPTHTGRLVHYLSNQPFHFKLNSFLMVESF